MAEGRDKSGCCANEYRLVLYPSGANHRFAIRKEDGTYGFAEDGLQAVTNWADDLMNRPSVDVLVLDEFGKQEARGEMHMRLWPKIVKSNPAVVVIAFREGCRAPLEACMGKAFDLIFQADQADALDQAIAAISSERDWRRIGRYGAAMGAVEVSVGSTLHATRFPLTGLAMSTTQAVMMTMAGEKLRNRHWLAWSGLISAGLKAFSPAGSRVGPMLAITMEGFLVTLAYRLLGWNAAGSFLAGFLAAAWAGLQGFLVQYLLFGSNLTKAYDAVVAWVRERFDLSLPSLVITIFTVATVYGVIAGFVTLSFWRRRHALLLKNEQRWLSMPAAKSVRRGRKWGFLVSPMFWLPLLIILGILWAKGESKEALAVLTIRAVAIAWLLGAILVWLKPNSLISWLRAKGKWGPAFAFEEAWKQGQSEDTAPRG